MRLVEQVGGKKISIIITLILTTYQLIRVIAFVNIYGGVEHDSGWALGVARSLAERGIYTSMVSTIVDPAVPGDLNVDKVFDIQAPDGGIWFRTSTGSIGPASIVPDSIVLMIFGVSFWTLRAGPLLFYTLFLLLAAWILYQLAGLGAIVLFHVFLFSYPHLSIFLSYEGLGEMPSMAYQLAAFLLFAVAVQRHDRRLGYFLAAGLVAGLAVNAKLLALLSIGGIFLWAGWLYWRQKQVRFRELVGLGAGVILVQAVSELAQLVILTHVSNFEMYLRFMQEKVGMFRNQGSGSGLRLSSQSGPDFMWRKFFMLQEVAHPEPWVTALVFVGILGGGLAVLWLWRGQNYRQNLLTPIWIGWLAHTVWFVVLAKTSWPRHFWFAMILAIILLSVIPIAFLRTQEAIGGNIGKLAGAVLLALIGWGVISQPHVWGVFLPDEIVSYWQQKRVNNNYQATLPWIIIPRTAQNEVVEYIEHMPPEANVYYPFAHKAAEIPPLTGRINYPLDRRRYPGVSPHPADILLIHPYLVSSWVHDPVMQQDLLNQVAQVCPQPVLKNDFYMICLIEELQLPQ
jgi:4-amino-4-deoxy-L-arabinose transferase-like glycosyltransferase